MSTTRAIKNKVKGKIKHSQGEINQARGKGIKGGMQKIQGKVQEKTGDIEMNADAQKTR